MRYTTPQVTNVLRATNAVQSIGLPADQKDTNPVFPDSPPSLPATTQNAYEADE